MNLFTFFLYFLNLFLLCIGENGKVNYSGYKVFRFIPENEEQLKELQDLEDNQIGLDFWKNVGSVNSTVDIMFPPHLQYDIFSVLSSNIRMEEMVPDVQKLIDQEELGLDGEKNINWTSYWGVTEIYNWLKQQAAANSNIAQIVNIGSSSQNRELIVIKIGRGSGKPQIWVDALLHAREFITGAVCTYLVNQLLNSNDPKMIALATDFEWHILCISNPDGYHFARTSTRMWRKTRSSYGSCYGADPNRNWAYKWMQGGASNNPCSDTHGGRAAFSEPETRAMSNYIRGLPKIVFYLSLHSYSQYILLPFGVGNSNDRYIPEHNQWMTIARNTANAIRQRYGTVFTPGNIIDLLYVASGGSMDWVKGSHMTNLKLAYTFELRDKGRYGFILPANQITPSSLEFIDGLYVMCDAVKSFLKEN